VGEVARLTTCELPAACVLDPVAVISEQKKTEPAVGTGGEDSPD